QGHRGSSAVDRGPMPGAVPGPLGLARLQPAGFDEQDPTVKPDIPDVLAARYASEEMAELWSPAHKIVLERRLWIAVLEAQRERGIDVPAEAIAAYREVVEKVDLASIDARERVTKHDVKARIEEFSAL